MVKTWFAVYFRTDQSSMLSYLYLFIFSDLPTLLKNIHALMELFELMPLNNLWLHFPHKDSRQDWTEICYKTFMSFCKCGKQTKHSNHHIQYSLNLLTNWRHTIMPYSVIFWVSEAYWLSLCTFSFHSFNL